MLQRSKHFLRHVLSPSKQIMMLSSGVADVSNCSEESLKRQTVKRKVALTLGFVGSKYYGLQFNAHTDAPLPTLEEDVLRALHAAGYISDMNANQPTKVKLSRASRTDKGVHAVRTVLTLKLLVPISMEKVNKYLPNDIRIFGAITTNAGFGGKNVSSALLLCPF